MSEQIEKSSNQNEQPTKTSSLANLKLENFEIRDLDQSRFIKPYQIKFVQNGKPRLWDAIITHPSVQFIFLFRSLNLFKISKTLIFLHHHTHIKVSCILFDTDKQAIILVKQFRPVVYVNQVIEANEHSHSQTNASSVVGNVESLAANLDWSKVDPNKAFTYELCAGLCDKNKSLEDTVREEIFEECGYSIGKDHPLRRVRSFRGAVGIMGSLHTIFYCEVNSSMKTGRGGGNENEGECIELFELPIDKLNAFIEDESVPKPPGLLFALLWFLYQRK